MTEQRPDHYEVLGVARNATAEEIKKAWRRKISAAHTDTNADGSTEDAAAINVAYETLSDPEKRAKYDRSLNLGGSSQERAMALDQISAVFSQWLDDPTLERNDPVEIVRNSIEDTLKRIHNQIISCRLRIDRLNRLSTRVKYLGPDGDNIYQGIIKGKLDDAQEELNSLDEQLRVVDIVRKLVREYEHNPSAPSPFPSAYISDFHKWTPPGDGTFFIDLGPYRK